MVMLFGDSGSATLLEKTKDATPVHLGFRTDGHRFKSIITPAGAYRNRHLPHDRVAWSDGILRSDYDTHMKGMDVFGFSITDVPQLMKDFMTFRETTTEDYDFKVLLEQKAIRETLVHKDYKVRKDCKEIKERRVIKERRAIRV